MKKKEILFVHSTGHWWDHRYYFKQMPALAENFAEITYLIRKDDTAKNSKFKLIEISEKKAKWARLTGGFNLINYFIFSKFHAIQLCNIELIPIGIFLSIFSNKKIFYDCREDHFHAMLHGKVWFPKFFRYLLAYGVKFIEFLASITFTGFITSDPMIYGFHESMPKRKKMIFYNMALKKQFEDGKINRKVKNFDFTVLGSMSVRTGVLNVVKAFAKLSLKNKEIKLKLIGNPKFDKVLYNNITEIIKKYKLDNKIKITGKVPYSQVPYELADCKIGIIPLLDIPKFRNNIATKQFEYMASSIPIIASDLNPQKIFIKNNTNGLHYSASDVDELSEKMLFLFKNTGEAKKLSDFCKNMVNKEWNSESQQKKYLEFYNLRMENKPYKEHQIPPFSF